VNGDIRAREVLVVGPGGDKLGVLALPRALDAAREAGLDLVEVAPNATPPVCRIADYGKMRYEASQRERAARRSQHHDELKEIKLRPGIGEHDYQVKLRKLVELLSKGYKVRVTVTLRGRMQSRPEAADEVLDRVAADLDGAATLEGRLALNITLSGANSFC